jgi:BolA family transcriptional regulator, general stress-responsive regulator
MDRTLKIKNALNASIDPIDFMDVIDDSARHKGHAGAKTGKGHYILRIASPAFEGKSPIQRHRLVYEALGTLMESEIHALNIDAQSTKPKHW